MSVTMDVSRLSGWLNALANCVESKRSHYKEGGMWAEKEGVGRYRACFERTSNISLMSVTLDVSRLSGWLNASASCTESKGSHEKESGIWADKEGVGRGRACVEAP